MKPAKGTTVTLVTPPNPAAIREAVNSTAGAVEQVSAGEKTAEAGSFASTKMGGAGAADSTPPAAKKHEPDKEKKGWIEIVLMDEEDTPQGGTRYKITLPDGSVAEGTLDAKGKARVDGFDPGQCKVSFPDLDEKVWGPK